MAGFAASRAPFVMVFPADDNFNGGIVDAMVGKGEQGADIVCASRFIPGGRMEGCPWLKALLVRTAAFTLRHGARLPLRDPTNGFRLFSRRVIDGIHIEFDAGFCFSIDSWLRRIGSAGRWRKCRRNGSSGRVVSRFKVLGWLPGYSALVSLRLCDDLSAPPGQEREAAIVLGFRAMKRSMTPRQYLILLHDLVATAAATILTFVVRFDDVRLASKLPSLLAFLPLFLIYAAVVYFAVGLYQSKWRFASLPDLFNIFRASRVLAVSLLVLDYILVSPNIYGAFFFGKITIVLYWLLQMFFLGGPRVAYRYFRYARASQRVEAPMPTPTLILGRAADAEVLLRAIESGAVKKIWPVGILSPSRPIAGSRSAVPVLGDFDDLESVVARSCERGTRVRACGADAIGARAGGASRKPC